ncbi:MAG: hypothetical protein AAGJ94_05245 [Pseudomonadota bacterium]
MKSFVSRYLKQDCTIALPIFSSLFLQILLMNRLGSVIGKLLEAVVSHVIKQKDRQFTKQLNGLA